VLGLVLFLIVLSLVIIRYVKAYCTTHNPNVAFCLAMLIFFSLTMTVEVIAFSSSLSTFVVYVLFFKNTRFLARRVKLDESNR